MTLVLLIPLVSVFDPGGLSEVDILFSSDLSVLLPVGPLFSTDSHP